MCELCRALQLSATRQEPSSGSLDRVKWEQDSRARSQVALQMKSLHTSAIWSNADKFIV
jgi:hypothetical protein